MPLLLVQPSLLLDVWAVAVGEGVDALQSRLVRIDPAPVAPTWLHQ